MVKQGIGPAEIERKMPFVLPRMLPLIEEFLDAYVNERRGGIQSGLKDAILSQLPGTVRESLLERMAEHFGG